MKYASTVLLSCSEQFCSILGCREIFLKGYQSILIGMLFLLIIVLLHYLCMGHIYILYSSFHKIINHSDI